MVRIAELWLVIRQKASSLEIMVFEVVMDANGQEQWNRLGIEGFRELLLSSRLRLRLRASVDLVAAKSTEAL
jgi:hypothetical protein